VRAAAERCRDDPRAAAGVVDCRSAVAMERSLVNGQ
jgi:hypothetical protein